MGQERLPVRKIREVLRLKAEGVSRSGAIVLTVGTLPLLLSVTGLKVRFDSNEGYSQLGRR